MAHLVGDIDFMLENNKKSKGWKTLTDSEK